MGSSMVFARLKRILVGEPLSNQMVSHARIPKWKALAILSSDALSSTAYATEEVLIPLAAFGAAAVAWSIPIALAVAFNAFIWWWLGPQKGLEFATGYLIEKSLSVDNIFVFVMLFTFFAVPDKYQHRVLFWGVLGALVMRFILILVGAALLSRFHWLIYIFGAFLLFTGVKMLVVSDAEQHPEKNPLLNWLKRHLPLTQQYHEDRFLVKVDGKRFFTPLFLVLVLVEFTDLIFAVDSIPAIFAVTTDPFIVYTSNVFAILGLRSLYFALAGVVHLFRYLKVGLAFVLMFVGLKMVIVEWYKMPVLVSLGVIAGILTVAVVASLLNPKPALPPAE
jgi:tellurite resistance protein TerC